MGNQITLDETITVNRPLHEVFAYISDFPRIEEWDPGVARGMRLTEGALGVGSEFQIDMKAGFSLKYTVLEWETNSRLLMSVDSKVFTAREEIRFSESITDTQVRCIATFSFPGPLALMAKTFPGVMDRVGKSAMAGMREALQDQFAAPEQGRLSAIGDQLLLPGILRFTRFGYRGARKKWNPVSAYMGDKHVLITGATSGLGLATAEVLASRGTELTLVARDAKKAGQVAEDLKRRFGNPRIHVELAELSLLAEVDALALRLIRKGQPIDVLINNAGALINPREETGEGLEKSFALLLLSPMRLTERLFPLLKRAARDNGTARVVNVLSGGMYSQKIRVNDLESKRGKYSGAEAYARAKRGLMILTQEWAARWKEAGIVVNAMHPGWADTPGVVSALPEFHRVTEKVLRSPAEGADTIVWLASATEAADVSGKFWLDREPHPEHLVKTTRETPAERQALLDALAEYV